MKLILPFLLATFLAGARAEHRRSKSRAWVIALASVLVATMFYSPRFL